MEIFDQQLEREAEEAEHRRLAKIEAMNVRRRHSLQSAGPIDDVYDLLDQVRVAVRGIIMLLMFLAYPDQPEMLIAGQPIMQLLLPDPGPARPDQWHLN